MQWWSDRACRSPPSKSFTLGSPWRVRSLPQSLLKGTKVAAADLAAKSLGSDYPRFRPTDEPRDGASLTHFLRLGLLGPVSDLYTAGRSPSSSSTFLSRQTSPRPPSLTPSCALATPFPSLASIADAPPVAPRIPPRVAGSGDDKSPPRRAGSSLFSSLPPCPLREGRAVTGLRDAERKSLGRARWRNLVPSRWRVKRFPYRQ